MPRQTHPPAGPEPVGHRAQVVRFGPFEANLRGETVRSDGSFVPIQQQPFRVLAALVERPGEIVTREELRERLWPDDLHVDFEHSLNTAIKKVRAALDDSPDEPRYVETVRGRGYRFVAPVERVDVPEPQPRRLRAGLWVLLAVSAVLVGAWRLTSRRVAHGSVRVVPLTSAPGAEYQPTFSPDGSQVAFTWRHEGNEDVYVQRVDVPEPRPLAAGPEVEHSPAWSPDGRWIAFVRDPMEPGGRARVVVVPPHGGDERVVAEYTGSRLQRTWLAQLAWSADSQYLALSRPDEGSETWSLYRVDVAEGALHRLTESSGTDSTPALSPDGRRLAFSRSPPDGRPEIRVLSLTPAFEAAERSTVLVRLEDLEPFRTGIFFMPAWTPDGQEIVFTGFAGTRDARLYRRGLSPGAEVRRLPDRSGALLGLGARFLGDPVFRPMGGELAVACWDTRMWDVAQVELEGEPPTVSVAPFSSSRGDEGPVLSPDGRRMAFSSDRLGPTSIWLSRLNGKELRRLTAKPPDGVWGLGWSPDGRWIAYGALVEDNWDVYVAPTDAAGLPRRLTRHPADDIEPSWSPDGNWIYFASHRSDHRGAWKVPVAGGTPQSVGATDVAHPTVSPDGRFLYFARRGPDRSRVWRMPVDGGQEELVLESVANPYTFELHRDAVYFLGPTEADGKAPLLRRDLVTSGEETLVRVDGPIFDGLTVSSDGRLAFYPRPGPPSADLVMIEGW